VQVDGREIELDDEGYLAAPQLWNEQVAAALARADGIAEMTPQHWAVVRFIRQYWQEHEFAPPVRLLCEQSGVGVRELYKLFTAGPARGACRIAGLPKPDGCV
jgi:dissimilatory sulfite reductase related protein